jgi:leucyl/phenylalanyl-tRNA---protein transferase
MELLPNSPIRLDRRLWFPEPTGAPTSGSFKDLVAIGGDLSVERLQLAYRSGLFPWSIDPITWWSPDPRGIFELETFEPSRSLAKLMRKADFEVTRDRAFAEVVKGCAARARGRESTWIAPEFIRAYVELHEAGRAHSLECWRDGELVGGIYGVASGGLFSGESMFHRADDASKVALIRLIEHLRDRGFTLFDVQVLNAHTRRLGAINIPRSEYLERLKRAVEVECVF